MEENWIISNLEYSVGHWNEVLGDIVSVMTQSPESFKGGKVWPVITSIHGALTATGYSLLVLFFVIGAAQSCASFDELKRPEKALKLFIRFALAKAVVSYGMDILLAFVRVGQGLIGTVYSSFGSSFKLAGTVPESIKEGIRNCSLIESVPLWAVSMLGCIIIWALSIVLILTVYGRFFKIYMYAAIAPIPMSSFPCEGFSSVGKSFLKSFAAVSLEGVVIVLCCAIYSALASSPPYGGGEGETLVQLWSYIGELIFNMLILVFTVRASDRIVKEMMGL